MAARRVSQASMQNIFSGFLPAEVVNSVAAAPVDTTTASETDILFTTAQASAEAGLQQVIEELERSFEVVGFEVDAETFADECDMEKIIATLVGESLAAAHAALSTGGTVDISGITTGKLDKPYITDPRNNPYPETLDGLPACVATGVEESYNVLKENVKAALAKQLAALKEKFDNTTADGPKAKARQSIVASLGVLKTELQTPAKASVKASIAHRAGELNRAEIEMQDHSRELHRVNFQIICYGKNKTALTEKLLAAETADNRALHRDLETDPGEAAAAAKKVAELTTKLTKVEAHIARCTTQRNEYARRLLGHGTMSRETKYEPAQLIAISKLGLDKDKPSSGALARLRICLPLWAAGNVDQMWPLAPILKRMSSEGIGGWCVPSREELQSRLDPTVINGDPLKLLKAAETLGFCASRPLEYMIAEKHTDGVDIPINGVPSAKGADMDRVSGELHVMQILEQLECYRHANEAAYNQMVIHTGETVNNTVAAYGKLLGARTEHRASEAKDGDAMAVCCALFLKSETYGQFASDDAKDALYHAAGCLMYDDVSRGIKIMREILTAAKDLHVHATYSQTIYRYMLRLQTVRPNIHMLMQRQFGDSFDGAGEYSHDCEDDVKEKIVLFIAVFERFVNEADSAALEMKGSNKERVALVARATVFHATSDADHSDEENVGDIMERVAVATGSTNENSESNPNGPSGLRGQVKWKAPNGYDIVVLKTEEQRSKATNYYKQMIFPNTQFRALYMGQIEYKGEAGYARKCDCSGPCGGAVLNSTEIKYANKLQSKKDKKWKTGPHAKPNCVGPFTFAGCAICKADAIEKNEDMQFKSGGNLPIKFLTQSTQRVFVAKQLEEEANSTTSTVTAAAKLAESEALLAAANAKLAAAETAKDARLARLEQRQDQYDSDSSRSQRRSRRQSDSDDDGSMSVGSTHEGMPPGRPGGRGARRGRGSHLRSTHFDEE